MSYSFLSPVVDGKIWSPIAGIINLSIIGPDKLPYMSDVEIHMEIGGNFSVSITMNPPYDEACRLIDSEPWFRLGNTLAIRWGYNDGNPLHMSDWFHCFMLPPEPSFGEEISITLKGNGYGWLMNRTESVRTWSENKKPTTFEKVAGAISQRYGLKKPVFKLATESQKNALQKEKPNLVQGGLTDFMYLVNEAEQNGVEVIFKQDHLVFVSQGENPDGANVAAEFRMYGKPDIANNIYPMINFTPKSFGPLFLAKGGRYMTPAFGPRSDTGRIPQMVKADATTDKSNNPGGKDVLAIHTKDGVPNEAGIKTSIDLKDGIEAVKYMPIPSTQDDNQAGYQEALDGAQLGDASDYGLEVDIDTVAVPTLYPRSHVKLSGVTSYFSTEYMIRSMDVRINDSGADASMSLCCKGLPENIELMIQKSTVSKQGEVASGEGGETTEPKESV